MRRLVAMPGLLLALLAPAAEAQVRWSASSGGTFIEHRTKLGEAIERSSGPSVTARGRATISSWLEVEAFLSGGNLKAERSTTRDQRLTELGSRTTVLATPWLALRAGVSHRVSVSDINPRGTRWTSLQLAAEVRQPILGTALRGLVEGTLMPVVLVSGYARDPNLATGARTGLAWEGRRVTAALRYGLTRYRFPGTGSFAHTEQLSTLTVELGLRLNGIPAR